MDGIGRWVSDVCYTCIDRYIDQAPVPLTAFRSISKFVSNFGVLYFKTCSTDHKEIPHTSRQLYCRDVCKISLWSAEYILNQSTANFGPISNSIEISLVGRAPGVGFTKPLIPVFQNRNTDYLKYHVHIWHIWILLQHQNSPFEKN